jgi:preprotein translocase subunit SecE
MARTRQKAKQRQAKRREQERKAQGTTGPKPASNPAERAVVDQAEAYEIADVLEEESGDVAEAAERLDVQRADEAVTPVEAPEPAEAPPARSATKTRERPERKPRQRERREGRGRDQRAERKREPRQRGRVINFMIQVWAELRRVQWPDRTQVTQATAVVVVFCILAGLYLALFDWLFSRLVKAIL